MNLETVITHSPALIVAVPLLGAFLTPFIGKISDKVRNVFVILTVGLTFFLVYLLASDVFANGIRIYVFGGDSSVIVSGESTFAIRILFEVDGMNAFMAIIASILAIASVIYSWAYMKENTGLDKFYTLILLLIAGMFGMILTGDLFNFFVFLEITSIASCALIAFWTNKGKSVDAGFKYIVISSIGALFVLFAIGILYSQYNALNMAVLANSIQYTFLDKIALGLLVAGLAMKAGIVPMHMWLPDAYGKAPSTVTLILIGATQTSIYGVLRVTFTLYGNQLTSTLKQIGNTSVTMNWILGIIIVALALITIVIGVLMALKQTDFKRMIAFAAVGEIGYIFLAIGSVIISYGQIIANGNMDLTGPAGMALQGGIFHIINDALDIGLLFLVAGAIYYSTKQTSLNEMGGLARNMKYTTVFFIIGLLAVAGMPPMNGFASKLLIYQSTYLVNPIIAIVAIVFSILLLAVFVKVFHSAFLGPKLQKFKDVKEAPKSMLIAMGVITFIIIVFGLFPNLVVENIIQPAAKAIIDHSSYITTVMGGVLP